jgi:membrane-associated protease RseP (regulator of RpoE activity)
LRGEVVVIGAHYDHLGLGGFGALDPDSTGRVHNGADDNASGTAALLEIARLLAVRRPGPGRTIVLVAFSGEELGTLGSSFFVQHPVPQPVDSIYAMLNLDMVGRLRSARLLALGAATAREFPALLDSLNTPPRFDLRASGDGWGPSDHAVFFAARRPVLHFFTDLHADYHTSTDDWEKINATGLAQVAQFVADLAWALANRPGPLTFVDAPRPQPTAGGSGYGAYLGTIPDMTGSPGGVRITGVRAGSPAEQAGLRAGDVITAIGAKAVVNLYDMTDALRSHQAGDTVVIVAKREGVEVRLTAVLGKRT